MAGTNPLYQLLGLAPGRRLSWLVLLRRRKGSIFASGFVFMLVTALGVAQMTPQYRSSARVVLDNRSLNVFGKPAAVAPLDPSRNDAILSELEVIRSDFLIGKVVDHLKLSEDPEFNGTRPQGLSGQLSKIVGDFWRSEILLLPRDASTSAGPNSTGASSAEPDTSQMQGVRRTGRPEASPRQFAIESVSGKLSVALLEKTFVIVISLECSEPTMSARIANTIAEAYLADQINTKNEANRRATDWLEQRLGELRLNLLLGEEAVAAYRRDKGLAGSPEGLVINQAMSQISSKYIDAKALRIERESRLIALSKATNDNPPMLGEISEVNSNAALIALRNHETEVSRRIAGLAANPNADQQSLVQARAELAAIRSRSLVQVQNITLGVRAELDAATSIENELREQLDRTSVLAGTASQYEAELKQLEREAASNRTLYESFLARFKELRVQDTLGADARVLSPAQPARTPSSPNYELTILFAFACGCCLGAVGVLSLSRNDTI